MARNRRGKEFSTITKDFVWRRQGGLCASCNEPLGKDTEYNHIVPIFFLRKYFPHFSNWFIKSAMNCEAVHHDCHVEYHNNNDDNYAFYKALLDEIADFDTIRMAI